ncbi:unnamed protein product [Brassica oleracea]
MMSPGPQRERHKPAKEGELQNHKATFEKVKPKRTAYFFFSQRCLPPSSPARNHKNEVSLKIWSCVCVNPSTHYCCFVLSLLCLRRSWSFRTKFILGFSVFLGLSIPQYFNEYTAIKGYGPVHTGARWFNDMVNVPFSSEPFVAGVVAFFLDNTLHKKDSSIRKDRGKHWWDKFRSFKGDTRSEEFYSLPFNLNKYFPCFFCFVPFTKLWELLKDISAFLIHEYNLSCHLAPALSYGNNHQCLSNEQSASASASTSTSCDFETNNNLRHRRRRRQRL